MPRVSSQCCDLVEDNGTVRTWRCRGGGEYFDPPNPESREVLVNGRWVMTINHGKVVSG